MTRWRIAAAFALAASLIVITQFAIVQHRERVRMNALLVERQSLEAELQAVKKLAMETEPVVVLENADGTRVIMDLDSAVQTASARTWD